jgi:hypothetical protein
MRTGSIREGPVWPSIRPAPLLARPACPMAPVQTRMTDARTAAAEIQMRSFSLALVTLSTLLGSQVAVAGDVDVLRQLGMLGPNLLQHDETGRQSKLTIPAEIHWSVW